MKKKLLAGLVTGLLLLLIIGTAQAGTLYAVHESSDSLVSIDTDSFSFNTIGALGTRFDFGGLAYDNISQTLYMVDGRTATRGLYTVDMITGQATLIGSHGITDMFGLAFDSANNTLFSTQFSGGNGLYSLDSLTGAATYIGSTGDNGIGGLAYNSTTDNIVGTRDGAGDIYRIDRSNGATTLLNNGDWINDTGFAYDADNNLYWGIDWSGNLYSWDIDNGYSRTTHLTGLGSYDGLAYINSTTPPPVPEPSTMILLGFGILGIAGITRRKMKK